MFVQASAAVQCFSQDILPAGVSHFSLQCLLCFLILICETWSSYSAQSIVLSLFTFINTSFHLYWTDCGLLKVGLLLKLVISTKLHTSKYYVNFYTVALFTGTQCCPLPAPESNLWYIIQAFKVSLSDTSSGVILHSNISYVSTFTVTGVDTSLPYSILFSKCYVAICGLQGHCCAGRTLI